MHQVDDVLKGRDFRAELYLPDSCKIRLDMEICLMQFLLTASLDKVYSVKSLKLKCVLSALA